MLRTILKKQAIQKDNQLQKIYEKIKDLLHQILETRSNMQLLMKQFSLEPTQQLCYNLEQLITKHDKIRDDFLNLEEQASNVLQNKETIKLYKDQYMKYIQIRSILNEYFNNEDLCC
ncbi:hypothetical protein ABPG74_009504 [Tetrahymena malaccensis]